VKQTVDKSAAKAFLAAALNVAPEELEDDIEVGESQAWDSLAHMRLLLALEEKLGKQLPAEWVVAIRNLDDIAALLSDGSLPENRVPRW
jgi:acyl carrier protein